MKIACVQMDIALGKPNINFSKVENLIAEAVKQNSDVIVLPEMWNTGYALKELSTIADENGNDTKQFLTRLSKKYAVNIVGGSVATSRDGKFFNTMYVSDRNGNIISQYDKAHLFKLMDEHLYLEPGQSNNIFQLDEVTCGGVICYDLRFPEWIRSHVLNGAKIMFIPAQWPTKRTDHWQLLLQARAIENQCFIVGINRVGSDTNNEFDGHSMVIAPWASFS